VELAGRVVRLVVAVAAASMLAACSGFSHLAGSPTAQVASFPPASTPKAAPAKGRGNLDFLISRYAATHQVPESLVRRVIVRESGYNPAARNGPYMGLMQISYATAKSMGYSGSPSGLLDPETNLKYAVKYLRGAYVVAGGSSDQAMRLYARGYYYDAKRKGLLEEAGLR
jgi:soluble lytic murein transglycosylase-like protein